jgi:hypothetical protein
MSQVSAILTKQIHLQRRAWIMNIFLAVRLSHTKWAVMNFVKDCIKLNRSSLIYAHTPQVLPIFFCVILLLLQLLVNLELSGPDYNCGCLCTSCVSG